VLVIVVLADRHAESPAAAPTTGAMKRLRDALSRPGTQLGFWSHFVTQSTGTVFTLLWGFPLLTVALGYSPAEASGILTLIVVTGFIAGPVLGILTARFPLRRSNLVIGIVVLLGMLWTAVLAWPGKPPTWLVVMLVVGLGIGGPGSLIGFDFARTFNPMRNLGSANGVVNSGGFLASFVMMYLIGVVLDLLDHARVASGHASDLYSWDSFRIALCVQYLVVGAGVVFLVVARRRTRSRLHREEGIQVAPLWVALVRSRRRKTNGGQ
jgi:MFS family permease